MAYSIQNRLKLYILVSTTLILMLVWIAVDQILTHELKLQFDIDLLAKSNMLITLTTQEKGKIEFDFADEHMPEYERSEYPEYFQLQLYHTGSEIERSHSLNEMKIQSRNIPVGSHLLYDHWLTNGRLVRVVEQTFIPHHADSTKEKFNENNTSSERQIMSSSDVKVNIAVARGLEKLHEKLLEIHVLLAIAFIANSVLIYFSINVIVKKLLKPIKNLSQQIASLEVDSLNDNLQSPVQTDELKIIYEQLNKLLSRLKTSFEREKQFSSDVAHELRTPLAELRAIADIGKLYVNDENKITEYFEDLTDISNQMKETVSTLLLLARFDGNNEALDLEQFNLNEIISESIAQLEHLRLSRQVIVNHSAHVKCFIFSDPRKLKIIFINLINNAMTHCPVGTEIHIKVSTDKSRPIVHISNFAPQLCQADLSLMFNRFWKKDPSRTAGEHSGLGLALVKSICTVLRIRINVTLMENHLIQFSLDGFELQ